MRDRLQRWAEEVSVYGMIEAARYLWLRRRLRLATDATPMRVRPSVLAHAIEVRPGTTDLQVYEQVILRREYGGTDDQPDVGLILDCGANVGYTSAYFLSRFPDARVIAVEPDSGNYGVLGRNLAPYGDRVRCLQAGIWPNAADLVVVEAEEAAGMGVEWAFQVRPCRPGEAPHVRGVDIGSLLAESGYRRISILKMDIEGAEVPVFADGPPSWLDRVDILVIELHDWTAFGEATGPFFAALDGQGFAVSTRGELTVCRRVP